MNNFPSVVNDLERNSWVLVCMQCWLFFFNFVNLSHVQLIIIPNWLVDIARDYLQSSLRCVFGYLDWIVSKYFVCDEMAEYELWFSLIDSKPETWENFYTARSNFTLKWCIYRSQGNIFEPPPPISSFNGMSETYAVD